MCCMCWFSCSSSMNSWIFWFIQQQILHFIKIPPSEELSTSWTLDMMECERGYSWRPLWWELGSRTAMMMEKTPWTCMNFHSCCGNGVQFVEASPLRRAIVLNGWGWTMFSYFPSFKLLWQTEQPSSPDSLSQPLFSEFSSFHRCWVFFLSVSSLNKRLTVSCFSMWFALEFASTCRNQQLVICVTEICLMRWYLLLLSFPMMWRRSMRYT